LRTRLDGYEKAMTAAGIPLRSSWVVRADFTVEGAYAVARDLLGGTPERPTAVFAASDEMAIGTILAARDFGLRVPEDLSVIGFDGHELGELFGLTTIDQDPRGQGALAVRLLLEEFDAGAETAVVTTEYPTRFVIRRSTAVPPS